MTCDACLCAACSKSTALWMRNKVSFAVFFLSYQQDDTIGTEDLSLMNLLGDRRSCCVCLVQQRLLRRDDLCTATTRILLVLVRCTRY